mgnify:CR=1 FL=1
MPEGDTVLRAAQRLDRALSGQVLTRCDLRMPQWATVDLTGATVLSTIARGKHLLTRFDEGHTLHTHLKMEGSWQVYAPRERWRRPAHQARLHHRIALPVAALALEVLVHAGERKRHPSGVAERTQAQVDAVAEAVDGRLVQQLRQRWNVNIVGSQDGYFAADQRQALFERIRDSGAKIVTVAMGSPRQEILMRDCRDVYPQALYMGVGGTYDVFTGHVQRAPKFWQDLGLEWFYRLVSQPSRIKRQARLLRYLRWHYTDKL